MLDDFGSSTCRSEMTETARLLELRELIAATRLHSCEILQLHSEESTGSLSIFMDHRLHGAIATALVSVLSPSLLDYISYSYISDRLPLVSVKLQFSRPISAFDGLSRSQVCRTYLIGSDLPFLPSLI